MTLKQQFILDKALELFALNGVDATSTSSIAKAANVSEGLIFRHFGNKEGLLNSIIELGMQKAEELFSEVLKETDPKKRLESILMIPFNIEENQHSFWKLLYSIKWQAKEYDASVSENIKELLINTFKELNYSEPNEEAELVLFLIDGIAASVLLKKIKQTEKIKQIILDKYKLK